MKTVIESSENLEWDRWVFSIASASHSANTAQTVTTVWTKRLVESFNTLQGLESPIQTLPLFLGFLTLASQPTRTPSKGLHRPPQVFSIEYLKITRLLLSEYHDK